MKVGVVGVGEMGGAMAGHLVAKGHQVAAFDIDAARLAAAGRSGIAAASSLEDLAKKAETRAWRVAAWTAKSHSFSPTACCTCWGSTTSHGPKIAECGR